MSFRYKGRRYRLRPLPIFLLFLIIMGICIWLVKGLVGLIRGDDPTGTSSAGSSAPSSQPVKPTGGDPSSSDSSDVSSDPYGDLPEGKLSDWNLILLNHEEDNKIDAELDFEKVKFDTQYVDSRAGEAYKAMADAAKQEGITLYLRSGYRSISEQQTNYNANVQREINRGNSKEEAVRLTNLYYTVPGHSEHHSGLAFDIITPEYHNDVYSLDERFADTDAYRWLTEHCTEYGFVLRYPKDKTTLTQINFEPWHYRYVGKEHAAYMKKHGLVLEEYIALLKRAGRE